MDTNRWTDTDGPKERWKVPHAFVYMFTHICCSMSSSTLLNWEVFAEEPRSDEGMETETSILYRMIMGSWDIYDASKCGKDPMLQEEL